MLEESNSDGVKCIYNPGNTKRVRFGYACQSSTPSHVSMDQRKTIYSAPPILDRHYEYKWSKQGTCVGCKTGAHWTINQGDIFQLPKNHEMGYDGEVQKVFEMKFSAVLYCRTLWELGEMGNWGTGECTDHPLRGASRVAKIYIDGVEVQHLAVLCVVFKQVLLIVLVLGCFWITFRPSIRARKRWNEPFSCESSVCFC